MENITIENYLKARYLFFKWRYNLNVVQKVTLALGMACLTGLAAQIKIALPWTPIPITGQTFAVLLSGVLLGMWWGGISQALYVTMGAVGVPWFSGGNSGYMFLLGPTGGYIIGFVFAALFIGYFADRYIRARKFIPMLALMLFANFVLIYIPGMIQLGLWSHMITGVTPTLWQILLMGMIPFVVGDITKIAAAAAIATGITPKQAFHN